VSSYPRDPKSVFWEMLARYDRTKAAATAARALYQVDPSAVPLEEIYRLQALHEAAWQAVDAVLDRLADLEEAPAPPTAQTVVLIPPRTDAPPSVLQDIEPRTEYRYPDGSGPG
jgi:hypothetical protein